MQSGGKSFARVLTKPHLRHGLAATQLLRKYYIEGGENAPVLVDFAEVYAEQGKEAAEGDPGFASRMLAERAITLDMIFSEMARRMASNMGEYLPAMEIYSRVALKA